MSEKKIKICYILPEYREDTDTHFAYLYDFLAKLSKHADIFVIAERSKRKKLSGMKGYAQRFTFLPFRVIENFIALIWAALHGYRDFYVHYSYTGAINASAVSWLFDGRVFYWSCGMFWLYGRQLVLRFILKFVDYLVTGTDSMAKEYAKHFGVSETKIKVMPNWIDLEKSKIQNPNIKEELKNALHIPADKKVILFVHRLSRRKGADFLPEVMRALQNENAVMIIIGDGPEKEMIARKIQEYGLAKKVRMIGKTAQRDLSAYYLIADVFIMPSEEEGFPHVLLEAMAYGVPFIACAVGGVRDIIPFGAQEYALGSFDVKEFAEKIRKILSFNTEEKYRMGKVFSEWIMRYDIHAVIPKFLELFQP